MKFLKRYQLDLMVHSNERLHCTVHCSADYLMIMHLNDINHVKFSAKFSMKTQRKKKEDFPPKK